MQIFLKNVGLNLHQRKNRTTNICKALHSKLNYLFIASHPNIYNLMDILKNIESETYIKIQSNGQRKSRHIIKKENYIQEKMIEYKNKLLTTFKYVKAVSFKFLPV
jgi:hypothetical protein